MAKKAKSFLPIIAQLALLHEKGFVHGDIRAFNTLFGEQEDHSELIDFDFGGNIGIAYNPDGYRQGLQDGIRIGRQNEKIETWHDCYALGKLIFLVHNIDYPKECSAKLKLR